MSSGRTEITRLLIIPAAGKGSRLGWSGPKLLCPVAGRPMVDWLVDRYSPFVDRITVVVAPTAEQLVRTHLAQAEIRADVVLQEHAHGMLPAVLCAASSVLEHQPDQIWITWCDQIAIGRQTVEQLAVELDRRGDAGLVFPTVRQTPPYIHFERDARDRIVSVLHRREGDQMPLTGESDAGLFALRFDAYAADLREYAASASEAPVTGERNFLPFIPWLAARRAIYTFELADPREAVGVNTRDDLSAMEAYLRERA